MQADSNSGTPAPVSQEIQAQVFLALSESERSFNELQSGYRRIASLWLLAVFSAAGYVLSTKLEVSVDRFLLIGLICAAGTLGLLLLWSMDLLVYHRLLDSYFLEGLVMERKCLWLPPIRHNMVASQQGVGVLVRVVRFYTIPVAVLAITALSCLFGGARELVLDHTPLPYAAILPGYAAIGLGFVVVLWRYMFSRTMASEQYFERRLSPHAPPQGF
jgi:hypothetical protein